jgi:hypothetical protein
MSVGKVIIIGKGNGWQLAPYEGETWGATQLILRRPVKRVIDMNDYSNDRWGADETRDAEKAIKLAEAMNVPYIDLKSYPIEEIKAFFKTDYFSNTIDYMIALAIYEGATSIDFYGVNMASSGEYSYQKPGVDYWCGQAMGRGIEINIYGETSTIMKTQDGLLYGYYTKQKGDNRWGTLI